MVLNKDTFPVILIKVFLNLIIALFTVKDPLSWLQAITYPHFENLFIYPLKPMRPRDPCKLYLVVFRCVTRINLQILKYCKSEFQIKILCKIDIFFCEFMPPAMFNSQKFFTYR